MTGFPKRRPFYLRHFRLRRPVLPLGICIIVAVIFLTYIYLNNNIQNLELSGRLGSHRQDATPDSPKPVEPQIIDNTLKQLNISHKERPDNELDKRLEIPHRTHSTGITREEICGGEPKNQTVAEIRTRVRQMMKHAWDSYAKYAWGSNELRPVTKVGHLPYVLGQVPLGATVVDGLDTLFIMGLMEEFENGREWIRTSLNITKRNLVSVFEFNIRYIGGLLSVYTFTLDKIFLDKAVEIAQALLPAFNTPTGVPKSLIDLVTHESKNFVWSINRCSILSEVGSLHIEFTYLSELTGDPIYADKVRRVREHIASLPRDNGLFYNHLSSEKLAWCSREASLAGLGDSFYEYLLKESIRNPGDKQANQLYNESMEAIWNNGMLRTSPRNNLLYVSNYKSGRMENSMEHLGCFVGGMLALGTYPDTKNKWFLRGAAITETCHQSYIASATRLGPEKFSFTDRVEAMATLQSQRHYLLRPETVESYFYMWRYTKDQKYRDWAFDVVEALKKYAELPGGYSGIVNTYSSSPDHDNVQQSYFLAETLKYLYLIFSEDSLLPLDRWIFNTEAHPLPIHNKVSLGNIWV